MEIEVRQKKLFPDKPLTKLVCPSDVIDFACQYIGNCTTEHIIVFPLNIKNEVLGVHMNSIGSINSSIINLWDLLHVCLNTNAARVIVAHNHPTGDLTPSNDDIESFNKIKKCLEPFPLEVLDFLIVNDYYGISLREYGDGNACE